MFSFNGSLYSVLHLVRIDEVRKWDEKTYYYSVHFSGGEPTIDRGGDDRPALESERAALINKITTLLNG